MVEKAIMYVIRHLRRLTNEMKIQASFRDVLLLMFDFAIRYGLQARLETPHELPSTVSISPIRHSDCVGSLPSFLLEPVWLVVHNLPGVTCMHIP